MNRGAVGAGPRLPGMEAALIVLIVIAVLLFVVVASSFKIINP